LKVVVPGSAVDVQADFGVGAVGGGVVGDACSMEVAIERARHVSRLPGAAFEAFPS
jgi:hypothetical protein